VHPLLTAKEAQLAGDAIDLVLAQEAAKFGVKQLFIIHPNDTTELVREYQIQPFVTGVGVINQPAVYVN